MNIIKMFFRDRQKISVDVFEAWEVRWYSRYGHFHGDTRPEIRVFTNKKDANEFKKALDDAYKLIKCTAGNRVTLMKQENNHG